MMQITTPQFSPISSVYQTAKGTLDCVSNQTAKFFVGRYSEVLPHMCSFTAIYLYQDCSIEKTLLIAAGVYNLTKNFFLVGRDIAKRSLVKSMVSGFVKGNLDLVETFRKCRGQSEERIVKIFEDNGIDATALQAFIRDLAKNKERKPPFGLKTLINFKHALREIYPSWEDRKYAAEVALLDLESKVGELQIPTRALMDLDVYCLLTNNPLEQQLLNVDEWKLSYKVSDDRLKELIPLSIPPDLEEGFPDTYRFLEQKHFDLISASSDRTEALLNVFAEPINHLIFPCEHSIPYDVLRRYPVRSLTKIQQECLLILFLELGDIHDLFDMQSHRREDTLTRVDFLFYGKEKGVAFLRQIIQKFSDPHCPEFWLYMPRLCLLYGLKELTASECFYRFTDKRCSRAELDSYKKKIEKMSPFELELAEKALLGEESQTNLTRFICSYTHHLTKNPLFTGFVEKQIE